MAICPALFDMVFQDVIYYSCDGKLYSQNGRCNMKRNVRLQIRLTEKEKAEVDQGIFADGEQNNTARHQGEKD